MCANESTHRRSAPGFRPPAIAALLFGILALGTGCLLVTEPRTSSPGPAQGTALGGEMIVKRINGDNLIMSDDFEDVMRFRDPAGWFKHSDDEVNETARSSQNPRGGAWGVKTKFTAADGNHDHISTFRKPAGYDALHMRVHLWIGTDYVARETGAHQHIMGWNTTREPDGAAYLDVGLDTVERNPYRFSITIPWQDNAGKNRQHNDRTHPSLWLKPGRWYAIEVACYSGADGRHGGTKLWIDGQLAMDHTAQGRRVSWKADSGWLGTCTKPSGVAGSLYFDDFTMAKSYIGPGSQSPRPIATVLPSPPMVRGFVEQ